MSEAQVFASKTNFAAGQLNHAMKAHKDLYEQGAKKLFNMIVTNEGVVTRRPPTIFADIKPSTFAPSVLASFNVTESISFLCIFYFDYNRMYIEIFSSQTKEKVFPVHIGSNVIEIEKSRYMQKVAERKRGKNYAKEELSYIASDNSLFFTAGDFVQTLTYNGKMHKENLVDNNTENKWQKVFTLHASLIKAKIVTKAFNRIWTLGAAYIDENTGEDIKYNRVLAGKKGTNKLYEKKDIRTDEQTLKEFHDALSAYAIDVDLGIASKPLWAISSLDSLYVGTSFGVFVIRENKDKKVQGYASITQSIDIGTADIAPCMIAQMVCFVGSNRRSIYAILPSNMQNAKQKIVNLNVSSSDIFTSNITQIVATSQPMQMLFAIKEDGSFATYTYNQDLSVAAWTNHRLGGKGQILSVCSIFEKAALGETLYFNVARKKESKEKEDEVALKAKKRRQELDRELENKERLTEVSTQMYETEATTVVETSAAATPVTEATPTIQTQETFTQEQSASSSMTQTSLQKCRDVQELQKLLAEKQAEQEEVALPFQVPEHAYFGYVLNEGDAVDKFWQKNYQSELCKLKHFKDKLDNEYKEYYRLSYKNAMKKILCKTVITKEDIKDLIRCEIQHEIKYKKELPQYHLIRIVLQSVTDRNWNKELKRLREHAI